MYYNLQQCYICEKETDHYNGDCADCKSRKKRIHRAEHFARLDNMTLEQRIRKIEEYLYEESINPPWEEHRIC